MLILSTMAQKTPAELRAEAEAALKPLGQERIRLLARLEELDAQLLPLMVQADRVEVPHRRISEITGYARNTVRAKVKPAG